MTPRTVYYDNQNHRVELGPLLASGAGGEGKVFKVVGQPASVAKIYHEPSIAANRENKLERMLTLPRPDPRTVAWPTATLHQTQRGRLVGFLMPFLPGKEVHELYGPGSRGVHFPAADWAFLIQAARNCAVAFDAVHRMGPGIAMGDVNETQRLSNARGAGPAARLRFLPDHSRGPVVSVRSGSGLVYAPRTARPKPSDRCPDTQPRSVRSGRSHFSIALRGAPSFLWRTAARDRPADSRDDQGIPVRLQPRRRPTQNRPAAVFATSRHCPRRGRRPL